MKINIKNLLIFIFTLVICKGSSAQMNDKKEKIESFKVAFITRKLDLSSKEAQLFWPLYNEYLDKLEVLKSNRKKELKNPNISIDNFSDKELEGLLDADFSSKLKEIELSKEYFNKFKSTIPIKKVVLLYKAEDEFKRELLRQISGK